MLRLRGEDEQGVDALGAAAVDERVLAALQVLLNLLAEAHFAAGRVCR